MGGGGKEGRIEKGAEGEGGRGVWGGCWGI